MGLTRQRSDTVASFSDHRLHSSPEHSKQSAPDPTTHMSKTPSGTAVGDGGDDGPRVAFLGPRGTYTHEAAERYFGDIEPVPRSSLREVLDADAGAAVIPFENSLGGGVGEAIDLLGERAVEVTGEQRLEIDHVVAGTGPLAAVERVRSHPQALSQCRAYLDGRDWETVEAPSTARAAREVGDSEAAICSRTAAEIHGLEVLAEDVQGSDANVTRFLVVDGELAGGGHRDAVGWKTSLVLEPDDDRPGLLANMLSCLSGHGINLSYVQSRPTKEELGRYFFYVEAEVSAESERFRKAVTCLETYTEVDVLGSYPEG